MRFTSITDRGGREINKDSFTKLCRDGIYCFVMADGEGAGGETGAELITKSAAAAFDEMHEVTEDCAAACINAASSAFREFVADNPNYCEMTASAAVLITDGKTAVCAHVGNIRLYYMPKGVISFVTNDHTAAMEKYASGAISFDEIRTYDNNRLTLAIDGVSEPEPETGGPFKIGDKTAFLFCTDGFWLNIDEESMEESLKKTRSSKEWLASMLRTMEETTPADCGNITVAAIIM